MSINQLNISDAAMSSGLGTTSAHETSLITLKLNSNELRSYHPSTGKRRRNPSKSKEIRSQLGAALVEQCPLIRKIKLADTGIFFIGRLKLANGRMVHATAYSLANLRNLLVEQLRGMEAIV